MPKIEIIASGKAGSRGRRQLASRLTLTRLAKASGIETRTREDLASVDRARKDKKKTSNKGMTPLTLPARRFLD